jgi:hypothetical protein
MKTLHVRFLRFAVFAVFAALRLHALRETSANGASPTSGTYLATTPTQKWKTVWLEPVSDKDYNGVK